MDKEIVQRMLARLARWAAVALVTYAVNKGWLAAHDIDQTTAELTQLLLEAILIVFAALVAGWLAIKEKLRLQAEQARAAQERQRTEIALTLPARATRADVEAILEQEKQERLYDTQP